MKLIIHRKKKFASALVPYYVILAKSKEAFINKYGLPNENKYALTCTGHVVPRADFGLLEYNIPISNGQTIEVEVTGDTNTVLAMTYEGLLSNEIILDKSLTSAQITISTKGGLLNPSYPVLIQEN